MKDVAIHFRIVVSTDPDRDGFYEASVPAWPEVRALSRSPDAAIAFALSEMSKAWMRQSDMKKSA
jgi:hypothetical protein